MSQGSTQPAVGETQSQAKRVPPASDSQGPTTKQTGGDISKKRKEDTYEKVQRDLSVIAATLEGTAKRAVSDCVTRLTRLAGENPVSGVLLKRLDEIKGLLGRPGPNDTQSTSIKRLRKRISGHKGFKSYKRCKV